MEIAIRRQVEPYRTAREIARLLTPIPRLRHEGDRWVTTIYFRRQSERRKRTKAPTSFTQGPLYQSRFRMLLYSSWVPIQNQSTS